MDKLIRLVVLIVSTACVLGGYPGYFGYQQPLPTGYVPTLYNPLPPPPSIISYRAQPAALPQHYYSAPPSNQYRGFAYQTEYQRGGRSHVVFVTGPESQQLMQQSLAAFRHILPVPAVLRTTVVTKPTSVPVITKTAPATVSQPITTKPIINSQEIIKAREINSQPIYNSLPIYDPQPFFNQPIFHSPPAISPVASVYSVQVFPSPAHTSPFLRVPFPHHPFISSFYSQQAQTNATGITNETADTAKVSTNDLGSAEANVTMPEESVGEVDESARAPEENIGAEENVGAEENNIGGEENNVGGEESIGDESVSTEENLEADENVGEAEENVGEADESVAEAGENVGQANETGSDPQESTVNQVDIAVPSLFLRLSDDAGTSTTTGSVTAPSIPEIATEESATEASSQMADAMEVTTPIMASAEQTANENVKSTTPVGETENDQTTVFNN